MKRKAKRMTGKKVATAAVTILSAAAILAGAGYIASVNQNGVDETNSIIKGWLGDNYTLVLNDGKVSMKKMDLLEKIYIKNEAELAIDEYSTEKAYRDASYAAIITEEYTEEDYKEEFKDVKVFTLKDVVLGENEEFELSHHLDKNILDVTEKEVVITDHWSSEATNLVSTTFESKFKVSLEGTYDFYLIADADSYELVVDYARLSLIESNAQLLPTNFSLVGSFNDWDESDTTYQMNKMIDNTYKIEYDHPLNSGTVDFKIVAEQDWSWEYGFNNLQNKDSEFIVNSNGNIRITEAGRYLISANPITHTVNVIRVEKYINPISLELVGDMNSWDLDHNGYQFEKVKENEYALTFVTFRELKAKIVNNDNYDDMNSYSRELSFSKGKYKIVYNTETNTATTEVLDTYGTSIVPLTSNVNIFGNELFYNADLLYRTFISIDNELDEVILFEGYGDTEGNIITCKLYKSGVYTSLRTVVTDLEGRRIGEYSDYKLQFGSIRQSELNSVSSEFGSNNEKFIITSINEKYKDALYVSNYFVENGIQYEKNTVSYTVTDKNTVTSSGIKPSGSSATFVNTYTTNKNQMTKDNSTTLTVTNLESCIIKGITLRMKSNKEAGSGSLSVKVGETEIAGFESSEFKSSNWYGSYSQEYVDVHVDLTNSSYIVGEGDKLIITIQTTVNSLYIDSYVIDYYNPIGVVDTENGFVSEYHFTLCGDMTEWDTLNNTYLLKTTDDVTFVTQLNVDSSVSFKIINDNGWDWQYGSSNVKSSGSYLDLNGDNILITEPGLYTITLKLDTHEVYIEK